MKKITTILLFFLCFCAVTFAQDLQEFSVVEFEEKPFDTSGKDERYKLQDGNGELFSIIKLLAATPDDDLSAYSLDFGYCEGRKKVVNGEVWWYVQRNAMRATIQREGFKQVKYELNATVQPGKVYEMTLLATPRVAKKRMLLFEVSPADSRAQVTYKAEGESDYKVFGDGMVDDGGMVADRLELGVYHYRIISKNYHPSEGRIELYDAPQKHTEKVALRPNYGTLTLKAAAGAGIYIDGEKVGTGQWSGILSPGNYNVECQFPAHKNTVKTINVNEGDNLTVQLDAPTPITGTLSLKSSPLGATVTIDGKEVGTTPEDFAGLLIGAHKITLSKSGYKEVTVDVEIKENETIEQNVVLEKVVLETQKPTESKGADDVFLDVEVQPSFPGGMAALMKYIRENIRYPIQAHNDGAVGRVFVRFVVDVDGTITNPEILRSSGNIYLDKEAIRLVNGMPKWEPGMISGKCVKVAFVLPVSFSLR